MNFLVSWVLKKMQRPLATISYTAALPRLTDAAPSVRKKAVQLLTAIAEKLPVGAGACSVVQTLFKICFPKLKALLVACSVDEDVCQAKVVTHSSKNPGKIIEVSRCFNSMFSRYTGSLGALSAFYKRTNSVFGNTFPNKHVPETGK
jgi:hypothetical protein